MANNTKQQAINTFTGGLNTDLHPLTTPNDILTDCINGTVITYNGNEYILQNDMGNYQLKKAQLPADYIPVGIKEYSNVIYIVSYNPIDKKCQIGSYPSPQVLFENTEKPSKNSEYHGIQINPLSAEWTWNEDATAINPGNLTNVLFTKYSPNQNLIVLFPETGDIKNTFLNPGDKYWLYVSDPKEKDQWKFQKSEYYALTESKEVYKINNEVKEKTSKIFSDEDMPYVTWETPGWLGYKPSLLNLDSFNIYLTDISLPAFLTKKVTRENDSGILNFELQGQATVSTDPVWTTYFPDLKVLFEYKSDKDGSNWIELGRIISQESKDGKISTNYGNKIDVLTYNISSGEILVTDSDKTITIRATPYIIRDGLGIVYDNFKVEYQINLNDLYSLNEIQTFDTYKYLVSDDEITINFSILSPTVNLKNIKCKYNIFGIDEGFSGITTLTNRDYTDLESANLLGQNMITILFDDRTKILNGFYKEEIYIFSLAFYDSGKKIHTINQLLITSEIMNDFYASRNQFQSIYLNEWLAKASSYQTLESNISGNIQDVINSKAGFFKEATISNIYTTDNLISDKDDAISEFNPESSTPIYSGGISKQDITLTYTVDIPTIFNNIDASLWGNCEYLTSVQSKANVTQDYTSSSIQFDAQEEIINKESNFKYSKVILNYAKGLAYLFLPNKVDGKEGKRWYIYKNIFGEYSDKYRPKYKGSTSSITLAKLRSLQGRHSSTQSNERGFMILKKNETKSNLCRYGYLDNVITKDSTFNIQAKYDRKYEVFSDRGNAENVDNFFNSYMPTNPSLFIPILFDQYGGGKYGGFFFPDASFRSRHTGWSESISLLCKQGSKITIAIIKFLNEKGRFFISDGTNSAYLTIKDGFGTLRENNDLVTKYVLGLGLHLYCYPTLENKTKHYLANTYQSQELSVTNQFKVNYTRTDLLQKVTYKNVNIVNGADLDISDLPIKNNITRNTPVNFKSIITKLNTYQYVSNKDLEFDVASVNTYINELTKKLSDEQSAYSKTLEQTTTSVYNDFTSDLLLQRELDRFANSLVAVTNGISSTIYYNGLPGVGIGVRYETDKWANASVRSIDLSSSLTVTTDNADKLLEVTNEWMKEYNGN